ncbi:cystathionine beta-lyase/cystathionine gamma-synthase [Peribacillus sp. B2I2]
MIFLIRLNVGFEHIDDLIEEQGQAIAKGTE